MKVLDLFDHRICESERGVEELRQIAFNNM